MSISYELHLALITVLTFTKFVASVFNFELTKDYIVLFLPVINYLSLESRHYLGLDPGFNESSMTLARWIPIQIPSLGKQR